MKNFLPGFALVALVALVAAGPAIAADLAPTYKAAPAARSFNWSGFYFGGTVGGGMAALPVTDMDGFEGNNFGGLALKSAGWVGGVHAGYNWQFAPSFLFGLEGDFNWSSFKASNTTCFGLCGNDGDPLVASSQLDHFSSFRARFGLTSDRTLLYVTGGPAFGHIKASMAVLECAACDHPGSAFFSASDSSNHWGVAIGAGVEYALTENWILRGEYMHLDFSAKNFLWANGTAQIDPERIGSRASSTATADIARVGVSYKLQ